MPLRVAKVSPREATYRAMRVVRPSGRVVCELPTYRETLPNGVSHFIVEREGDEQELEFQLRWRAGDGPSDD